MAHSREFEALVDEVKARVTEVSVAETRQKLAGGAILIDVRENHEWFAGHASGATHIARGVIERDIVSQHPDKQESIVL